MSVSRQHTGLAKIQGNCKWCNRELEGRHRFEPKFCNPACQEKYELNTGKKRGRNKDSAAVAGAKQLAFDNLYDPVRDLVREEVRNTITQRVRDNVLGMTELLSDMLPLVLNGLAVDIQSEDVFIRQKAQALILKYVMPLQHEQPQAEDSKTLNVIHRVAVPDTILGHAVEAEAAALPPGIERFEEDWPTCFDCGERKNPATGRYIDWSPIPSDRDPLPSGELNFQCHACDWRSKIKNKLPATDPYDNHLMG